MTWREARYGADRTVRVRVYLTEAERTGQGQDLERNLENMEAAERVDVSRLRLTTQEQEPHLRAKIRYICASATSDWLRKFLVP